MTATVMFHSVGLERHAWAYRHIAEPVREVEHKLAALKRAGIATTFFGEAQETSPSVALTFDDGYLDNWVHLFPILERHGLKATVFMTTEFVDPRPLTRPRVPEGTVQETGHEAEGCCAGFLSWPEIVEMERSGLVRVESHGLTHTWYPCGPRVVDFWSPGAALDERNLVWMLWNRFPKEKPFYLTRAAELEPRIPYGTPIYENGKAMDTRRYTPSSRLDEILPDHVAHNGGEAFFRREGWREELHALVCAEDEPNRGEYETEGERRQRLFDELARPKEALEQHLGREVDCLCWPGGSATELGLSLAREVGYRKFTVPSAWQSSPLAAGPGMISRVPSLPRIQWHGWELGPTTPRDFVWWVRAAANPARRRWTGRLLVIKHLAGLGGGRRSGHARGRG